MRATTGIIQNPGKHKTRNSGKMLAPYETIRIREPHCPVCNQKNSVGRVTLCGKVTTYFCVSCSVEFDVSKTGVMIGQYDITDDGTRIAILEGGGI